MRNLQKKIKYITPTLTYQISRIQVCPDVSVTVKNTQFVRMQQNRTKTIEHA